MTVEFEITTFLRNNLAQRIRDGLKNIPLSQILSVDKGFTVSSQDVDDHNPDDIIVKLGFNQKKENVFVKNKVKFQFMHDYSENLDKFRLLKNLAETKPKGQYSLSYDLVGTELTTGELLVDHMEDLTEWDDKFLNLDVICVVLEGVSTGDINFTIDRDYIEYGDGTVESTHWYENFIHAYKKLREERESGLFTKPVELENPDINIEIEHIIAERLYPVFDYIQDFFGISDIIIGKYSETERGDLLMGKLAEIIYTHDQLGKKFNEYLDSQK